MIGTLSTEEIESILTRNRQGRIRLGTQQDTQIQDVVFDYDGRTVVCRFNSGPVPLPDVVSSASIQVTENHPGGLKHIVVLSGFVRRLTGDEERVDQIADLDETESIANGQPIWLLISPTQRSGRFMLGRDSDDIW